MASEISIKVEGREVTGIIKGRRGELGAAVELLLKSKKDFLVIIFAAVNKVILENDYMMDEWNEVQLAAAQLNEKFKKK